MEGAMTFDKLKAAIDSLGPPLPPPPRIECVPSHRWRTRSMWDRDVTPADRWQMWCKREASDEVLERNPIHDAMPSNYLRMSTPTLWSRHSETILCRGEAAYHHLVNKMRSER